MENQKPKKRLSLPTIAVSIFCVLAIIFGKDLAYGAISITINLLDIQLSLVNIVWIQTNMTTFGLIVSISSATVLSYYLLRSRLRVDLPKTRRQAILFGTTLAIGLFIVSSLFVPSSLAGNFTATASYHLQTPLPIAQAYCGQYDNSSYFGINGANWQNVIVSTNKTLVEETMINSVTSGNIWSEVSFDYANLACPANISFTENVNGVERTFGNLANSQGSPYTISVGSGADANQYFGEDRKGTIIWSSTNVDVPINNALAADTTPTVVLNDLGEATCENQIVIVKNGTTLYSNNVNGTILKAADGATYGALLTQSNIAENTYYFNIYNLQLDGNKLNVANTTMDGLRLKTGMGTFSNLYIHSFYRNGIYLTGEDFSGAPLLHENTWTNLRLYNNGGYGGYMSAIDQKVTDSLIYYNANGLYAGSYAQLENNHAYSNTGVGFELAGGSMVDNCESETGVLPEGQLYGFGINSGTDPIQISNCKMFNMRQGVRFNGNVSSFTMTGCIITNPNTIGVYVPVNVYVQNFTSIGCTYQLFARGTDDIKIDGGLTNFIAGYNTFTGGKLTTIPATNYFMDNNVGFVTENSGNSTGTGSEVAILHGCNFTPTFSQVMLSERSTGGALAYQSTAPNATCIFVTATNEKDFNWQVARTP